MLGVPAFAQNNSAQSAATVTVTSDQALAIAGELVAKGKLEEAEVIIDRLMIEQPDGIDQTQVSFLKGMIAASREDYEAAEKIFRDILADRPDLVRIRLELARVLFEQEKDTAAAYHFRLVMGNGLPDEVIANVKRYLTVIENRKVWRVSLSMAAEPSTNINAGPDDERVTLFGLPFQLSDDALSQSGVGVSTSLNISAMPQINSRARLEARAGIRYTDYEGAGFDDAFAYAEAGPRISVGRLNAAVLATTSRRQFGGDNYSTSYGARLVLTTSLSQRTRFSVNLSGQEVDYDQAIARNGPVWSGGVSLARILDRRTRGDVGIQITREDAEADPLKNTQTQIYVSIMREFPWGITAAVRPEYIRREFDERAIIDPEIREDEAWALSMQITKRDWSYHGFAPVFRYSYLTNSSTLSQYEYDRHSVDVSATREF
ncbi:DUF560 domain-containing protein [Parvularcula flava]|uniref:DUF560 domain-containing protein n=1 Tax=Aquisalinus luteolus TaxID=1566827 RepID=A0A8J3A808_9PROT|nr:surface lipoprotein assembly modifier [Aquisalinus luteolus]NHK28019.1 DUF560 domain-containing protein [Aquisalinus luteolus]GGH97221.1 peptide signal protein [Aquisalinus luteolus]